jgi:hypothetical protein
LFVKRWCTIICLVKLIYFFAKKNNVFYWSFRQISEHLIHNFRFPYYIHTYILLTPHFCLFHFQWVIMSSIFPMLLNDFFRFYCCFFSYFSDDGDEVEKSFMPFIAFRYTLSRISVNLNAFTVQTSSRKMYNSFCIRSFHRLL